MKLREKLMMMEIELNSVKQQHQQHCSVSPTDDDDDTFNTTNIFLQVIIDR